MGVACGWLAATKYMACSWLVGGLAQPFRIVPSAFCLPLWTPRAVPKWHTDAPPVCPPDPHASKGGETVGRRWGDGVGMVPGWTLSGGCDAQVYLFDHLPSLVLHTNEKTRQCAILAHWPGVWTSWIDQPEGLPADSGRSPRVFGSGDLRAAAQKMSGTPAGVPDSAAIPSEKDFPGSAGRVCSPHRSFCGRPEIWNRTRCCRNKSNRPSCSFVVRG